MLSSLLYGASPINVYLDESLLTDSHVLLHHLLLEQGQPNRLTDLNKAEDDGLPHIRYGVVHSLGKRLRCHLQQVLNIAISHAVLARSYVIVEGLDAALRHAKDRLELGWLLLYNQLIRSLAEEVKLCIGRYGLQ